MKLGIFWRVLPVHVFILGLFLVPLHQRQQAKVHALQAGQQAQTRLVAARDIQKPNPISGQAVRILIPRLVIDVTVVPGVYDKQTKTWSVSPSAANYAPNTVLNNNVRNQTFIYGHWTNQVLGPTKNLVAGDVAYVYTDNNHVFKYTYTDNDIVKPTDTQIFDNLKGNPGLVLMTCDGNFAQNRRLMHFNLEAAQ